MLQLADHRVLLTGGAGFLGRSVQAELAARGLPAARLTIPRSAEHDLTREADVERLFAEARPEIVIHLAARIGGLGENLRHPGQLFHDNLAMGLHLVEAARRHGVQRFVQVGTSCAYPQDAPVPQREADLWSGYPEPVTAPYGIAKKALFVLLETYAREYGLRGAVVVPSNLYGPGDDFDPATSHVIPALIRRFDEARLAGASQVECWGNGEATRDFLFVSDAARAVVDAAERIDDAQPINVGSGRETSIRELAELVARLTDFTGELRWNADRPAGQPRRCLDTTLAKQRLGWRPEVELEDGLRRTVAAWRASATACA